MWTNKKLKITWGIVSRESQGDAAGKSSLVLIASYWHYGSPWCLAVTSRGFLAQEICKHLLATRSLCCHHGDLLVRQTCMISYFPYPSQCRQEPLDRFHTLQEYEKSQECHLSPTFLPWLTLSLCFAILCWCKATCEASSSLIHIRSGTEALSTFGFPIALEFLLGRLRWQYKSLPLYSYSPFLLLSALK